MSGLLLFLVSMVSLGAIYAMLCVALNLESGVGGLWDLGIVSFFGIGAYAYVIVTAPPAASYQAYIFGFEAPVWAGMAAAMIAAALFALLIGALTLRLKREYFLITTLAFAEVIRQIFVNEAWLTNGVAGIYGLRPPLREAVDPSAYGFLLLALLVAGLAIVFLVTRHMVISPFGRSLKAVRENEALAITAGIAPRRHNLKAYVVAGTISGLAGVFYVWYNTIVTPGQYSSDVTFFVWTAVIIGGLGSLRGALVGGFIFVLLHDILRFVPVSGEAAATVASLRTAVIGLALILILRWRPNGLFPERATVFGGAAPAGAKAMVSHNA
ncbi:branched-chain amino acid ABC transporter permease [Methylobrevis pamukkalensis]|uniref:Leucine/isoleucine/valine transporter permease subunit n=1 Tax=Methylobrevis pamukkalensis TaxID=1439726 RepID=A0A1E3H7J9_9HYPH|nr:branched-chain amino acid ABC transporter permease [Methylobrevis pamukkalensis]ODN72307.1 leucine/isoleucine/valine transporter permease subunit [Methylobrevis pamukkalensis]